MKFIRIVTIAALSAALLAAGPSAFASQSTTGTPSTEVTSRKTPSTQLQSVKQSDETMQFVGDNIALTVNAPTATARSDQRGIAAADITCNLDVQWPHGSTHVSGTINEVVRIDCKYVTGGKAPMGGLRLAMFLARVSPNFMQWHASPVTNTGASSIQNNKAVSCAEGPGDFRGWGWGTLTPPPGYSLVGPADYDKFGDTKATACGVANKEASTEPGVAERISVTFTQSGVSS